MPTPANAPISSWIIILPLAGSRYAYASETKNPLKSKVSVKMENSSN